MKYGYRGEYMRLQDERRRHERIMDGIFFFALGGFAALGVGVFLWMA